MTPTGNIECTVVVDVGCATYEGDRSIEPLVARFQPETLFGFDPQVYACEFQIDRTRVVLQDAAAWVADGHLSFVGENLGGRVAHGDEVGRRVRCVDLVRFLTALPTSTVVKLDAEGSEYPIIERLIETRVDAVLALLLVEWHCHSCRHGIWSHAPSCDQLDEAELVAVELEQRLACPVERWES